MPKTKIEWTDETWNPVTGCTKVSAGCENCYAERMTKRLQKMPATREKYKHGFDTVVCHEDELARPYKWGLSIRDQCKKAGVPFFFKGWGGVRKNPDRTIDGNLYEEYPEFMINKQLEMVG